MSREDREVHTMMPRGVNRASGSNRAPRFRTTRGRCQRAVPTVGGNERFEVVLNSNFTSCNQKLSCLCTSLSGISAQ